MSIVLKSLKNSRNLFVHNLLLLKISFEFNQKWKRLNHFNLPNRLLNLESFTFDVLICFQVVGKFNKVKKPLFVCRVPKCYLQNYHNKLHVCLRMFPGISKFLSLQQQQIELNNMDKLIFQTKEEKTFTFNYIYKQKIKQKLALTLSLVSFDKNHQVFSFFWFCLDKFHPKDMLRFKTDDNWLMNFLDFNDFNIDKSLKQLWSTLEWRQKNEISGEKLRLENFQSKSNDMTS